MTLITMLVVSAATLYASGMNRRVPGMRLFALGLLSLWFGAVLGIARVVIPGNAIVIACNVFMFGGMITAVQGIRTFRGLLPLPLSVVGPLVTLVSGSYFYWMFVRNVFAMRVAVVSPALAFLAVDAAASMLRRVPRRERPIYWPTGFAFVFTAMYLGARALSAFTGHYGDGMLSAGPMELASGICSNVAYVGCAFGMLIASDSRLLYEAEKKALFDPLTNLPNRRLVLDRLLQAEHAGSSAGMQMGVIYLDLDGFKLINDRFGHGVGDEFLCNVSAAMNRELTMGDCLGRVGGDEFLALIENADSRGGVKAVAERLKAAVENEPIPGHAGMPMSASYGIAVFPGNGQSAHDAVREADLAMYREKRLINSGARAIRSELNIDARVGRDVESVR
jgi:diguanylate cyclase (GGDEF)-like protein